MARKAAPYITIKHYVNIENNSVASGAVRNLQIIQGVGQTAVVNSGDVVEGSLVKAAYLELWFKSNSAAGTENKFQFVIEKVPANQDPITFAQMNNLMSYPNKKNVFFVSQGVTGDLTTNSIPVFRDWLMIPKGKQRFGLDDELFMSISATGAAADTCGVSTFKEVK